MEFKFEGNLTYGETLGPAMNIETQEEANQYVEAMLDWYERQHKIGRAEGLAMLKSNLGYYAGYYSHETRLRVERLFRCAHPIFGAAEKGEPTPEEAFELGKKLGEQSKEKE